MKVTYTAPNRSHHYPYAQAMAEGGVLHAFVSGFPRLSKSAALPAVGNRLKRRDAVQLVYLAALRTPRLSGGCADMLAYLSKCYLDRASHRFARDSDVFLAYNGCALDTFRRLGRGRTLRVLEVVNSHVDFQDTLLRDEHARLGMPYRGVQAAEKRRRLAEYDEADFILCPSSFVERSLVARGIAPGRIIKNAYGFRQLARAGSAPKKAGLFRILYVGSLSIRKGLRYLVEAVARLKSSNVELWLVGPGDRDCLAGVAIPPNVRFAGVLKGAELAEAYAQASVFVLPSIEEGLALVMAEALSFGLPIIATENTGADDLITDGKEGFIVPIRDAAAIALKLQALLDDPGLRERLAAAAAETARTVGGWDRAGPALVRKLGALPKPSA